MPNNNNNNNNNNNDNNEYLKDPNTDGFSLLLFPNSLRVINASHFDSILSTNETE